MLILRKNSPKVPTKNYRDGNYPSNYPLVLGTLWQKSQLISASLILENRQPRGLLMVMFSFALFFFLVC
jgi:hypothetical protein